VGRERLRVDLRHHQRHRSIHAKGRGVVDHRGARLHRERREAPRGGGTRGEQCDVHALEAVLTQLAHLELLAAKREPLAGRARRGEEPQLRERKAPLLEAAQQLDAHRAGGSDHGDDGWGACSLLVRHT